nr:hypothetical protein [Pandoravirus massiliensis]
MQPPVQDNASSLSAAPTTPISIDIGALPTYDGAGPCQCLRCCAARTPAPPYIDWARLWAVGRRAAVATASGIDYCARTIAAAAPAAFGFYGATMGIGVGVAALALRDSWLRCAVELRPLCYGHVNGLVVICATAYAVDSAARDRKRRGLSTGLLGIASRVMCMATALGVASCGLGSLAHHLAYTDALRERWWHYGIDNRYERGMADGISGAGVIGQCHRRLLQAAGCVGVHDGERARRGGTTGRPRRGRIRWTPGRARCDRAGGAERAARTFWASRADRRARRHGQRGSDRTSRTDRSCSPERPVPRDQRLPAGHHRHRHADLSNRGL